MRLDAGSAPAARQHVLVLTSSYPSYPGDPAGHFVAAEVQDSVRAGHRVTVLCPGDPTPEHSPSASPSIELVGYGGGSLFGSPGVLPRLRENSWRALHLVPATMRTWAWLHGHGSSVDRVVAHWLFPAAFPWIVLLPVTAPVELVAHGSDVRLLLKLPRWIRLTLLNSLEKRRVTFRFVSQQLKAEVLESGLPSHLRAYVARATVKPAALEISSPNRDEARRRLGIEEGRRLAVVCGRLIEQKRVDVALRALSLVPDLMVAVLGDGPERARLHREHPDVQLLGEVPRHRALEWMAAADLLVAASRTEGSPTVVREARALGTPVVSATAGDLGTWAKSDSGLWLVD